MGDVRGASRTHDRLRHDALHLGRHGDRLFDARRARGLRRTGAARSSRGTPLLGSDDRARARLRECLEDGRGAVSHRATDARRSTMRVRMNRARVALGPSPSTPTTVLVAESTPPTVGAADRPLRGAFSASRPSPAPLSETRPPARRSRRPDATPHRVSPRTMGGSRNSGRAVGGGGLGSVRLPQPAASRKSRRVRLGAGAAADPSLTPILLSPTRPLLPLRAWRGKPRATARTSAATTGDTSSRGTTATSPTSSPTGGAVPTSSPSWSATTSTSFSRSRS